MLPRYAYHVWIRRNEGHERLLSMHGIEKEKRVGQTQYDINVTENERRRRFPRDHGRGSPNRILTVMPLNTLQMQRNPFHPHAKQTALTKRNNKDETSISPHVLANPIHTTSRWNHSIMHAVKG